MNPGDDFQRMREGQTMSSGNPSKSGHQGDNLRLVGFKPRKAVSQINLLDAKSVRRYTI